MRQRMSRLSGGALLALLVACGTDAKKPRLPPNDEGWWRDRVVYEVFVRSFADSDQDGRGDLAGLTASLDYLNDGDPATDGDLGVGAIWLMPIFASPSYHGYDVTDYRSIHPDYGTLADFDAFVAAAHARGLRVVLDMVLNHSSNQHPWFVSSRAGPSSERRDWYHWRPADPGWRRPWDGTGPTWYGPLDGFYYYGVFWGGMPDLNLANPAVEAELVDTMKFWLARGVDGFRLDAARYLMESDAGQADLPATHAFLKRIRAALQREYPETLLVGEIWTGTATVATYYGEGDELQLAFSFDLAEGLKRSAQLGAAASAASALGQVEDALRPKDRGFDAPFLSNHDQIRVRRAVGSDPAARVAAATLLALPGTPFVYYGEELGMQGTAASRDEDKRAPMRWTADAPGYGFTGGTPWHAVVEGEGVDVATQRADPGSLWHLYRRLIALRAEHPPLAGGSLTYLAPAGGGEGVLAFVRSLGGERVLFVANYAAAATGPFTLPVTGTPTLLLQDGTGGPPAAGGAGVAIPDLGPRSALLVSLD